MRISDWSSDMCSSDLILQKIVALNNNSEHPLAQATSRYGKEKNVAVQSVSNFEAVTGKGVTGKLKDDHLALGNSKLMEQVSAAISPELEGQVKAEQKQGKTVSYLAIGKAAVGFVVIYDKIKKKHMEANRNLNKEGVQVRVFK